MVEEEENEEGGAVGGGENLERGGGELVAESKRSVRQRAKFVDLPPNG